MIHKKINNIVMLGAGNVATHMAAALHHKGFCIKQVFSRTSLSANELAKKVDADFCTDLNAVVKDADLYIISLSDDASENILQHFDAGNAILVHTSGTLPLSILDKSARHYGVLYPVQTFSKNKEVNFSTIPFCIEANKPEVKEALIALATCLSYDVREISTQARQIIHLAAVFACNFPNYLFVAAADILESREISFDILLPLIWESLNKISDMSPWQAQTGPAIRGDSSVIDRHLQLLAEFPEYKDIYRLMSEEIICRKQKKADN